MTGCTWVKPDDEIAIKHDAETVVDGDFICRVSKSETGFNADVSFAGTIRHEYKRSLNSRIEAKVWAETALDAMKNEVAPFIHACSRLSAGLHFIRRRGQSRWELVELRPKGSVFEAYAMAWDCPIDLDGYDLSTVTPANIRDPDGNLYEE